VIAMLKKIILIVLILIIGVVIIGFMGLTGRSEFASNLLGMNKAKDLGVTYNEQDLDSLRDKIDPQLMEEGYVSPDLVVRGDKTYLPVNTTITQSEASAYLNESINQILAVESFQVSFGSVRMTGVTNVAEITNLLQTAGVTGATLDRVINLFEDDASISFYVDLDISVVGGMYDVNIHTAKIGRFSITSTQIFENRDTVNNMVANAMENLGLTLDSFEAGDEVAIIEGLIDIDYMRVTP
jgi:hypothetical protein